MIYLNKFSFSTTYEITGDIVQATRRLHTVNPLRGMHPPPNIIIFDVAELGQDVVLTPLVESL